MYEQGIMYGGTDDSKVQMTALGALGATTDDAVMVAGAAANAA